MPSLDETLAELKDFMGPPANYLNQAISNAGYFKPYVTAGAIGATLAKPLVGAAYQSGKNLLNMTHNAMTQGAMYGPESAGPTVLDLANISLAGAPAASLAANTAKGVLPVAAASVARPFFSQVAKTVEDAPLTSAPASQWLGTIKNAPGVKPEELDWTGLENWLKEQKGQTVTKPQISDFVKANQVNVQDVVKGGPKTLPQWAQSSPNEWTDSSLGYKIIQEPAGSGASNYPSPVGASDKIPTDYITIAPNGRRISRTDSLQRAQDLVEQSVRANPENPQTKFSQYQLPGGENYRELLLTMPQKEAQQIKNLRAHGFTDEEIHRMIPYNARQNLSGNFITGHYDEPNVLAHVRFNDRTDVNGKKTLFLEELQSDWHQRGRKYGYDEAQSVKPVTEIPEGYSVVQPQDQGALNTWEVISPRGRAVSERFYAETPEQAKQWALDYFNRRSSRNAGNMVPDAPFKSSWPDLALKRMVEYAADNGYDQIAWTPGEVQAARYDLSKQVDRLNYNPQLGELHVYGGPSKDELIISKKMSLNELDEHIGKEAADKIRTKLDANPNAPAHLDNPDLKVGGEGMKGFYDKMLPAAANKLGKKYGAKVGVTKIGGPDSGIGMFGVYRGDQEIIPPEYATAADARVVARQRGMAGSEGYTVREGTGTQHQQVWSLPITDAMRSQAVSKGFPLFSTAPPMPTSQDHNNKSLEDQIRAILR